MNINDIRNENELINEKYNQKTTTKKEEWFNNQVKPIEIIDELSELCKSLIDEYHFYNALSILKAIIEIDK